MERNEPRYIDFYDLLGKMQFLYAHMGNKSKEYREAWSNFTLLIFNMPTYKGEQL